MLQLLVLGSLIRQPPVTSPISRRVAVKCMSAETEEETASTDQTTGLEGLVVPLRQDQRLSELPTPPHKGLNLFWNLFDSISFIIDPDKFVAKRSADLGPVFIAYNYFKPVVFLGGKANVVAFTSGTELRSSVVYPALPDTFVELHTKWGSLNLDANDELFKEGRALFKDVLSGGEAMSQHTAVLEREVSEYVDALVERVRSAPDTPIYLAPELKSLCLQAFAKSFSGQGLTAEQEQMFIDYNAALLSLSRGTAQFKKGLAALETLKVEMLRRFRALDSVEPSADVPGKWYHNQLAGRPGFESEDRVATGVVLFVWAAYVECASLMLDALVMMRTCGRQQEMAAQVRAELAQREASGVEPSDFRFWDKMPFATGVLRETLRLEPPGSGVPRYSNEDFELVGYRIPAGTPVMMEPRIGNMDPSMHAEPQRFEPTRWMQPEPEKASQCPFTGSALKNGRGSWFPGGYGAHQCPGVPLAELVAKMFVAKMSEKFETWEFNGDGLTKEGKVQFVVVPVKIPPDDMGLKLRIRPGQ